MRSDIQCLRGIAIILVLLYHLYPSLFVNGFLGVDIFFVISGFLMGSTLTRSPIDSPSHVFKFYYRRFKRILPLYYLTLLVALLAVQFCLGDFWWNTNHRYAYSALLLKSNQLMIEDGGNYFAEFQTDISSMNVFIHTWSLGVEMQFYLIVPFIFLALQCLRTDNQKLIGVTVISVIGYLGFEKVALRVSFSFMPLRLWQFSAGFISLFWIRIREKNSGYKVVPSEDKFEIEIEEPSEVTGKGEETRESRKISIEQVCMLVSLLLILLAALPFEMELRLLVTLATAFLIACDPDENIFLTSPTLCFIGDISYVMYLVHWPIITILNSYFVPTHAISLEVIFVVSVILHELFEKQYLKLEWKWIVPLTIFLFVGNAALQYSVYNHQFWSKEYSSELQKVIDDNQDGFQMSWKTDPDSEDCVKDVIFNVTCHVFGQCRYEGTGNLSILMLGNSYTMSFEKLFRAQFHQNYSSWRYMSLTDNEVIYSQTWDARSAKEVSMKHVELYQPDVLVIMSRYVFANPPGSIQPHDSLLSEMTDTLAFYQKFAKKIYILDVLPLYPINFLNKFLHYVTRQQDMESLHLNKKASDDGRKSVSERLRRVDCEKCRFFDLSKVFVEGDKYLMFDRRTMTSYVDNTVHLTKLGVEKCEPMLKSLAKEILV